MVQELSDCHMRNRNMVPRLINRNFIRRCHFPYEIRNILPLIWQSQQPEFLLLGKGKSTSDPSKASSQRTCDSSTCSGKLGSHGPLFPWRRRWAYNYSHICSLCWNVTELLHTRTESSWNSVLDHMVPAIWCNCPYSESIHGIC
jgi:hypothetical protein